MAAQPSSRLHRIRHGAEGFVGELSHALIDVEIALSEAARTVEADTHTVINRALSRAAAAGHRWSAANDSAERAAS